MEDGSSDDAAVIVMRIKSERRVTGNFMTMTEILSTESCISSREGAVKLQCLELW
jgi:hypothetical protein